MLKPMDLRPTRFTGFTATLTLKGCVGRCAFRVRHAHGLVAMLNVVLLPVTLVVLRGRANSTLICLSFFLVLCERKVAKAILFSKVYTIMFFVINLGFDTRVVPSRVAS